MKLNFKKIFHNLFSVFLIVYIGFMLYHTASFSGMFDISFCLIGFILAVFAHARKNYITIILFLIHMSIEWFEWSQKGINFNLSSSIFNLAHVIMDFVFLSHELSAHIKKKKSLIFFIVVLLLITVSFLGHFIIPKSEEVIEIIEPFVIGGILGCVISHSLIHLKYFNKSKLLKNKKEECL